MSFISRFFVFVSAFLDFTPDFFSSRLPSRLPSRLVRTRCAFSVAGATLKGGGGGRRQSAQEEQCQLAQLWRFALG